jgi:hypothetical protein
MSVERVFKLTPPDGAPFYAAVVSKGGALSVASNRAGKWDNEPIIGVADLVMPEQALSEWDVEEIGKNDPRMAALKGAV